MSKFAVIKLAGKQFKVQEGDLLTVDRLNQEEDQKIEISDVLLIADEKKSQIGTPTVKDARVTLKVVEHGKDKKLRVGKFRAKSRYRRVKGHRQHLTTLEVVKITA